jgi:membrane-bound lytic murein transglycosylase D
LLVAAFVTTGPNLTRLVESDPVAAAQPDPAALAALADLHLPPAANARVEKWMRRFRTTERVTFETYLSRESVYGPLIREKLRERDMPSELVYLAMIESGFLPGATSTLGAGGVWQFMSATARQFGLRVDWWVDERRDPVRATTAALDYLQFLHERYGSWHLAAAAYNTGYGRVDRLLGRRPGGGAVDVALSWTVIEQLPRETRDYIAKFVAATTLAHESERHTFAFDPQDTYMFERVWVPGGTSLARVAREVGLDDVELRSLNPHLLRGVTPPGVSYELRIPMGSVEDVMGSWGVTVGRASDD